MAKPRRARTDADAMRIWVAGDGPSRKLVPKRVVRAGLVLYERCREDDDDEAVDALLEMFKAYRWLWRATHGE